MRRTIEVCALFLAAVPLHAERGYPQIEMVSPGAVSRGTTTDVLVAGRYILRDPVSVLFAGEGISAAIAGWKELPVAKGARASRFPREGVTLRVTVAEDAAPGIRPFHIVTKGSITTVGHLLVSDAPCVIEAEPNESNEQAQSIQIPQTVNGLLDEDADNDVYKFHARGGERISFIVHAARLQQPVPVLERAFSDLTISLRDESGRELASADDWTGEDPQLFHEFQKEGTYFLHLREARYLSGKDKWWYALSALSSPQITSVFPPVIRAGMPVNLELQGFNLEGVNPYKLQVPVTAQDAYHFRVKSANGGSNVIAVGVTDLPEFTEPAGSGLVSVQYPVGIAGRIGASGEVDRYRFRARQGERLEFQVRARHFGSSLDALLEIWNSAGRLLDAKDDDANTVGYDGRFAPALAIPPGKDPRMEWTAPADGQYEIRLRDANFFGSKEHVYHLAIRPQKEDFALIVDEDRLPVGPGESVTCVVTVERRNGFQGPVKLFVRGLPPGLTAMDSVIPSHLDQGHIVLTAAPDAEPQARTITIGGVAAGLERIAKPHAPMGSVNGKTLLPVESVVAAVVEASDIIVEATPKSIRLRPGEALTIDIKVKRNNYRGPVELNAISWVLTQTFSKLPKGIVVDEKESKTSLGENETQGRITFRAQPDAPPLEDYLMTIMGQIAYNRVFMTRSADAVRITIPGPLVSRSENPSGMRTALAPK